MEHVHVEISGMCAYPDTFLRGSPGHGGTLKNAVKCLYDHMRAQEIESSKISVPELYIQGMDEEQIWQQLELQNNFTLDTLVESSSKFLAMKYDSWRLDLAKDEDDIADAQEEDSDEQSQSGEAEDELSLEEDLEEDESPDHTAFDDEKSLKENGQNNEEEEPLEDDFFQLKELNRFLDEEDRKEMNKSKKPGLEDDDGIDLFQDLDDDHEDDAADLKYADFFDKPKKSLKKQSYVESDDDEEDERRTVKFNLAQNEEFSDTNEDQQDVEESEKSDLEDDPKSTHEERQDRLKKRIAKLEQKSISDKPWQLKGEVKASARPENSLLEEYLEFDSATRPAPLITEETTKRLDDIILQRIKDRAFDDVELKARPSDASNDFRKRLVLDQTKSKESLAQIYEKDFMAKVDSQKDKDGNTLEEEPQNKRDIREKMRQLMAKLDALSNYHFTPKPAAPDIKIITNTPAIEMEEAAPVAISDATLLAPEEVKRPDKGDVIGRTERNKTDKNRERRRKKLKQKLNASKETKSGEVTLEKVTKARNVQKMKENSTGKELKSSKEFFSKLQEEVKKKGDKKSSKRRRVDTEDKTFTAKKLKL